MQSEEQGRGVVRPCELPTTRDCKRPSDAFPGRERRRRFRGFAALDYVQCTYCTYCHPVRNRKIDKFQNSVTVVRRGAWEARSVGPGNRGVHKTLNTCIGRNFRRSLPAAAAAAHAVLGAGGDGQKNLSTGVVLVSPGQRAASLASCLQRKSAGRIALPAASFPGLPALALEAAAENTRNGRI
jgi:hypothetical protein